MKAYPILVDGEEVDTGQYTIFPDMEKVIEDPGLGIALQMRGASVFNRFVFSRLPSLIPKGSPEMRYLRDYRRYHGVPKYTKDELDEVAYAKVCLARESDINRALDAGVRDHKALFNPFKEPGMGLTLEERTEAVYKAGIALKGRYKDVAEISVKEGTPIRTLKWTWELFDLKAYRQSVDYWGGLLDVIETPGRDGGKNYRFREPYGVTCLFTPYNSPIALGIWSFTSSILAGNSTILKPPNKVPLSSILLGQIYMETVLEMGLPPATVQVLTGGGKQLMHRFMTDSRVGAIVWYGDSDRGLELWADSMKKRIQMAPELAGSDACLVWGQDVDLQFAAKMITRARYLGSGQACMAVKRLLVQDTLHDELVRLIIEEAEKLQVGLPSDPKVSLPPVGLTALYLLIDQLEDAVAKGAKIQTGGYRCNYLDEPDPAGLFYKPTVLTDVTVEMRVMQEEVFAPALPVVSVSSVDEAIGIANGSRYGLRSPIFTDNANTRRQWAREIEAAGIIVGQDPLYYDPPMPHLGGYKDSGIIGGKYFTEMLTRMKYVHVGPDVEFTQT
jgi:lactaldehyde dehydrogenase